MDKSFLVLLLSVQVIISGQPSMAFCRYGILQEGYLRCKTGVAVTMYPDGRVNGTQGDYNKFAILRTVFQSQKYIVIYGVEAKKYLCMTARGKIYGSDVKKIDECVLQVNELAHGYTAFSRNGGHRKMCIGFSRTGKPRKGHLEQRRSKFIWLKKKSQRTNEDFLNMRRRHCKNENN